MVALSSCPSALPSHFDRIKSARWRPTHKSRHRPGFGIRKVKAEPPLMQKRKHLQANSRIAVARTEAMTLEVPSLYS